jgi:hypothetical protein
MATEVNPNINICPARRVDGMLEEYANIKSPHAWDLSA